MASQCGCTSRNCGNATSLTTRLVDTVTTPLLLRLIKAGKLRPAGLVTHRFGLDDIVQAYDAFAGAAKTSALKVVPKGRGPD
jgi:alcohol dehydrogenase